MSFDYKDLTPIHITAARALLRWKQEDLAEKSGVSKGSVQNVEKGDEVMDRTIRDIFNAFEKEGIEFYNGDEPGVRKRKKAGES